MEKPLKALRQLLSTHFPTLEQMECWLIWAALCREDFNQKGAAKLLGISERVMSYKLSKLRSYYRELLGGEECQGSEEELQ